MIIRFVFGLIFLILIIVGCTYLFGLQGINRSLPQYEGEATVQFAKHPVTIYRDSFALAHIYGETDADAYYALGYTHGQERLFQMDLSRRFGSGKLSEIIGEKGVILDRWARTIGFNRIATAMWNAATPETRSFLASYTNGVNDYISSHRGKMGFEFDALHYEPEYWKPTDCMIIGRLMSWEMNFAFWNDAAFADISGHIDSLHLASLFPGYPANSPTILGDQTGIARPIEIKHTLDSTKAKTTALLFESVFRLVNDSIGSLFASSSAGGGSNCVALSPRKTTTGFAMLENDMHLGLGAPARWYLVHLHSNQGLNVAGFTIPGLPLVLSGRNESISWGLTNGMIDELDYFNITLDSGGKVFHTPYGNKEITSSQEIIRVRTEDQDSPIRFDTVIIRSTDQGPIVSALPTYMLGKTVSPYPGITVSDQYFHDLTQTQAIALQWNGLYSNTDELGCFFKMHHARSIIEVSTLMKDFATPCLNMSLASAKGGDIAYRLIGRIPIRSGSEEQLLLPRDAAKASDLWQGFTTLENNPRSDDPASGYIVSANNPASAYRQIPQGQHWEPPGRAERLNQLVSNTKKIDRKQLQHIVTDISSPFDYSELRPSILAVYRNKVIDSTIKVDVTEQTALDYIENWDGVQDTTDITTAILNLYLLKMFANTFSDELGIERFNEFCYINNVPVRTLGHLLTDKDNIWWDDIRSPQHENRDDIVKRAFTQTITWLTNRFGNDVRRWNWGKLHSLTYEHFVGKASPLVADVVNIRAGMAPGGLTTVIQASYSFWNPFLQKVGPSMRMIADMSSSSLFVSLPTGNSGNVFSPHYRDMLELFKKGTLIEMPMNAVDPKWKKLTLKRSE